MNDSSWFRKYADMISETEMHENFSSVEEKIALEVYSLYVQQNGRADKDDEGYYELDDDLLSDVIADYIEKNPKKVEALVDQEELEHDIGPKPNPKDIDHTGFQDRISDWEYEKRLHIYHIIHDLLNHGTFGFVIVG